MREKEGTFKGVKDLDLYYRAWLPDKDSKAVLVVIHGLAEHIGRYKNLVNYLVPRGYAVYGHDMRGHGKSQGVKGYLEQFSYYIDDLTTFFDLVRHENPGKKIFIVGHSMGTLATSYAVEHQKELAGLVLSGALIKVGSSISPATIAMVKVLAVIAPKMGVAVLDASAISKDKAVVDAYVNDPLVYRGKTSARLGAELLEAIQRLPNQMSKITLPILIMYGSEDKLSEPEGSHLLYQSVSSKDKTLKVYDGLYHEIFNEPEHEKVLADVEEWLEKHLK